LLEPLDLPFSLHAVLVERLLQAAVLRRLGHLRQGLQDLMLGEVDILQRMQEQLP
jgi:hypothetical protein